MKQLKLAVVALLTLVAVSNVTAQDSNNPWAVSFGTNAVDFRIPDGFGDITKDYFGTSDWNIIPMVSRISAEKYIKDGFTLQFAGSLSDIETFSTENDTDALYWSLDLNAKYDLNNLFGDTDWFDPFVSLGGGYASLDGTGEMTLNIGYGFNLWFNDNMGVVFQSMAKKEFADKVQDHFQHSLGLVIRFGGKDTDGDGVYDKDDACPETAGLKEFNGCPDADGDGVKDSDDACPNTAGLASLNGCPDADGDGIADKDDMCPNAKGTKANKGCPDTDGDGVIDKNDKCVNVAGPSANNGCPWPDTDGDGVLDKDDKCPNEVGPASNNGCKKEVISVVAQKKLGEYAKTILFNSGKSTFRPGVSQKLDEVVTIMKEFSRAEFVIEGHTDSVGRASSNKTLSTARAKAVLDYLISKGIDASRLESKGYGEERPIESNSTSTGRAINRRVEILVTNQEKQ